MPTRRSATAKSDPIVITTVALPEIQHARLRLAVDDYLRRHGKKKS